MVFLQALCSTTVCAGHDKFVMILCPVECAHIGAHLILTLSDLSLFYFDAFDLIFILSIFSLVAVDH